MNKTTATTTNWKCLKNLGAVKLGDKTELRITIDTDGEKAMLNLRSWVNGTTPTKKGIAFDLDNEELLLAVYNAIGIALDKPVKVAPAKAVEAKPELSKNAKRKLERYGVTV